MARLNQIVRVETQHGTPVSTERGVISPVSQAIFVRFPFGGYVWNRPIAIEVQTEYGVDRLRIRDVTLMAQLSLYMFAFIAAVVFWLINRDA